MNAIVAAQNGFTIQDIFDKEVSKLVNGAKTPAIPTMLVDGKCIKSGMEYKDIVTTSAWKWLHVCPHCKSLVSFSIKESDMNGKEIMGHKENIRVRTLLQDGVTEVSLSRSEFVSIWDAMRDKQNPNWRKEKSVNNKLQKALSEKFGGSKSKRMDGSVTASDVQNAVNHFRATAAPKPEWVYFKKRTKWVANPEFNGGNDQDEFMQVKGKEGMRNTKTGQRITMQEWKLMQANLCAQKEALDAKAQVTEKETVIPTVTSLEVIEAYPGSWNWKATMDDGCSFHSPKPVPYETVKLMIDNAKTKGVTPTITLL